MDRVLMLVALTCLMLVVFLLVLEILDRLRNTGLEEESPPSKELEWPKLIEHAEEPECPCCGSRAHQLRACPVWHGVPRDKRMIKTYSGKGAPHA